MFKYILYKFGQFCVTHLPLKAAYKIASFISDLHYFLSFRDRRAVENNLKVILPDAQNISALSRDVFRNFGKYLVDFFRMAKKLDVSFFKENIKVHNKENLDRILSEGKGGIILTAHIGNWELGGVILTMLGYPLVAIALPHRERYVNDLFNEQRQGKGMSIVQTNDVMRRCIEILKENKLLALLADRDFSLNGEILDFLGKKAFIPKGPAVFSKKTGAPILPAFLIRNDDENTFTLSYGEPIYPPAEDKGKETVLEIMRKYTSVMEQKIKEHPTQWLMFREFWAE